MKKNEAKKHEDVQQQEQIQKQQKQQQIQKQEQKKKKNDNKYQCITSSLSTIKCRKKVLPLSRFVEAESLPSVSMGHGESDREVLQ